VRVLRLLSVYVLLFIIIIIFIRPLVVSRELPTRRVFWFFFIILTYIGTQYNTRLYLLRRFQMMELIIFYYQPQHLYAFSRDKWISFQTHNNTQRRRMCVQYPVAWCISILYSSHFGARFDTIYNLHAMRDTIPRRRIFITLSNVCVWVCQCVRKIERCPNK